MSLIRIEDQGVLLMNTHMFLSIQLEQVVAGEEWQLEQSRTIREWESGRNRKKARNETKVSLSSSLPSTTSNAPEPNLLLFSFFFLKRT